MALRMNIGCGTHLISGWVNMDVAPGAPGVVPGDVLAIPCASGAAEAVILFDVIEHLHPRREVPVALAEVFRVLTPGGVLRVSTPDLAVLAKAYVEGRVGKTGVASQPGWYSEAPAALQFSAHCFGNNSENTPTGIYDGHQALWDEEALGGALRNAGFRDTRKQWPGESLSEGIRLTVADRWPETSLIMEGRRWA